MKFKHLVQNILNEGTVFKSYSDAENYCKLIRKTGIKCKPIKVKSGSEGWGYWQVKYNYQ